MTQHSPNGFPQLGFLKSPSSDQALIKDKYRPTPEDNDKLKKLTSLWDSRDGGTVQKTGVKRKASVVMETQADSTDDSLAAACDGGSERMGRKQPRKDLLLTRLLSTTSQNSSTEPSFSPQTINAIAVGTPQMNLVRRSSGNFYTVSATSINSTGVQSNSMKPPASSPSGRSGGGPNAGTETAIDETSGARAGLTSSLLNGNSNLQFLNACDMESDDDLTNMLHSITPMENDSVGPGEESALLSQLARILSSPSIELAELDSLLGDGSIDKSSSTSSKRFPTSTASESTEMTTSAAGSQMTNESSQVESMPTGNETRSTKGGKKSGTGLLQQLLGGHDDQADTRVSQTSSFRLSDFQRFDSVAAASSTGNGEKCFFKF